jgi:carboxylesterase type B
MYSGSGEVVPALKYGPQCIQVSGGSEDCLFLNIWTPSLPTPCTNTLISRCQKLRPVLFWIFGGGFTENSAADPNFDGGNMASRGDVVMIAVNYRVGAFGFLALKDGVTNGNFGIADQILGLDWVRKHIQDFGGDPEHITIVGQSSGGASVRALMASPRAAGKFIAAVPMSAPGSKGFSDFYTIDEANDVSGNGIVDAANCTDAQSQVDCLRGLDAATLVPIGMTANFLVIDGVYLITPRLQLTNATQAPYRLMTGFMRDDAAPFLSFPPNITGKDQEEWLTSQGIPNPSRSLFPLPDLTNQTLAVYKVGARVYTDIAFRCMNQAAAYAGLKNRVFIEIYFFEFDRSYQTPDWPLSDLCEAPRLSGRPFGDPEAEPENFHCHSGQLLWVFGNIRRFGLPYRDEIGDMEFEQNIVDRWASFVRGGTPDVGSEWEPAVANKTQMLSLKWPKSSMTEFRDLEQCEWLGLPLDYLS